MGLGDWIVAYSRHRSFVKGGEFVGAAEAMQDLGHFGPASRLYDEALGKFVSSAADSTFYQTRHARDVCRNRAIQNGEDPTLAFRWALSDVERDPQQWIDWYYRHQGTTVLEFCREYYSQARFQELSHWANAAQKWTGRLAGMEGVYAFYNCEYFGGAACFRLGRFKEAQTRLQNAYRVSRSHPGEFPLLTMAWDAFFLGSAISHSGGSAGDLLTEALSCFCQLRFGEGLADQDWNQVVEAVAQHYGPALRSGDRARMVTAAKEIEDAASRPRSGFEDGGLSALRNEARTCLELESDYSRVQNLWRQNDYAEATALCVRMISVCGSASLGIYKRLAEEAYAELVIEDPGRLPEHSITLAHYLAACDFDKADTLYNRLLQFHRETPELAHMARRIQLAKQTQVDAALVQLQELMASRQTGQAEALFTKVSTLAHSASYAPTALVEAAIHLARLKAEELAAQSQEAIDRGDCGKAVALLEAAVRLPDLDQKTLAGLRDSLSRVSAYRDDVAQGIRAQLAQLLESDRMEEARSLLADAKQKGIDGASVAERELVELHFDTLGEADRARGWLNKRNLVETGKTLEAAAARLGNRPLRAAAMRLAEIREEYEALWSKVEANFVSPPVFLSIGVGVVMAVLHGVLARKASLGVLVSGGLAGLLAYGAESLWRAKSFLAHNGHVHGLALGAAAGITYITQWFTPWLVHFALGAGAFYGLSRYLRGQCPCARPRPAETAAPGGAQTPEPLEAPPIIPGR